MRAEPAVAAMSVRPIFERFPALAARQPWVELIGGPSPVHALDSTARLWIKRDDLNHPLYAGNKMRKFECVVGEWRARGIREVVTIGAIGTNCGLATACMALQEGLACRIVMFPQPLTATVRANLRAMQRLGARLEYHADIHRAGLRWGLHPMRLRPHGYALPGGASVPGAVLAFVNAALELKMQIDAGLLPAPAEIVVAAGSVSTFAGLSLGCAIAGVPARVIGVRVMQETILGGLVGVCNAAVARRQMRRAARTLGWGGALPEPLLVDGVAAGYGVPTAETTATITRFRDEYGITLECTYSAKAAAHALRLLAPPVRGPVLFWNTFNSRPLDALPRAAREHPFPPPIARALAHSPGDTP